MYLALLPFPKRPVIQTIPFLPGKNLVHNTPHNLSARTRSHKAWQLKSTPETKLFICHKNYLLRNIPPIPSKPFWVLALPQNILFLNRVDRSLHLCPYHDPWREPNYLLTGRAINWEQVELKTPLRIHSEIQKKIKPIYLRSLVIFTIAANVSLKWCYNLCWILRSQRFTKNHSVTALSTGLSPKSRMSFKTKTNWHLMKPWKRDAPNWHSVQIRQSSVSGI